MSLAPCIDKTLWLMYADISLPKLV